jgi:hypothetical protein
MDDLTLDLRPASVPAEADAGQIPSLQLRPYTPERQQQQRDWIRMIVTVSVLSIFAWVIVWASIESRSWPDHWNQTKELLQIVLPAVTGLIGSVTGFYFGTEVGNSNSNKPADPVTGR